ncbi:hypothetical protein BKA66DRAFT_572158 [Pyrenochaeta sp. MPI-SDFR-AT-0127]|nr:hypothetical protein BKA66DRAFT_572158 [Pyrenochaeta sp. MPI-SDFR-AT-0127]
MVASSLKATFGAVYEDSGDDAVNRVMQHLGFFDHALLKVPSMAALHVFRTRYTQIAKVKGWRFVGLLAASGSFKGSRRRQESPSGRLLVVLTTRAYLCQ